MGYYDTDYFNTPTTVSRVTGSLVWTIIALVLAIGGGIVLYFTVFSKKNENKYTGFMQKLYNFVHFKYFVIDDLFKILYMVSALSVTLLSLNFIGHWQFLVYLIGGNIVLRISYELFILFIDLCHNVRDIANKKK